MSPLEIHQDLGFQRRQSRVARIATLAFVLVGVAALLGLTGSGPLSDARRDSQRGLSVGYERFLRYGKATELELERRRGTDEVRLSEAYLEGFDVDGLRPEPDGESTAAGRTIYTFEGEPPGKVTISLTPREIGLQRAEVSASRRGAVSFRQVVYP